jgi:hypothetical protein
MHTGNRITSLPKTVINIPALCQRLQQSINTWEGTLKATGGAIVLENSFWYLINFKWAHGNWRYNSINEDPEDILIKDILGEQKLLQRHEVSTAKETLGIHLAPNGSTVSQEEKMKSMVDTWVDQMRRGKLSKTDVWTALQSTIWRTISYPLPALNLSKKQCKDIMRPLLLYCLPSLGICRNFPRALIFGPMEYSGLGFKHLFTDQEIARLQEIVTHTSTSTMTGNLYRLSLELLILELGADPALEQISLPYINSCATPSLVRSTYIFLKTHQLIMRHDIYLTPRREADSLLMPAFLSTGASMEECVRLIKCRMYLRVCFISDLATSDGLLLSKDGWSGIPFLSTSTARPKQGRPTRADWQIWQKYLKLAFLVRGRRLQHSLGGWLSTPPLWKWFLSPQSNTLVSRSVTSHTGWEQYSMLPPSMTLFSSEGSPAMVTMEGLHPASVTAHSGRFRLLSHSPVAAPRSTTRSSFAEFLQEDSTFHLWHTHL